jgi:hypothetical protein
MVRGKDVYDVCRISKSVTVSKFEKKTYDRL